ncbi:MFS transporter [Desulforhopalus singaporensis]|uniref:Drug resistance transporter, EmrB/QacA subfamily n=1 Tax=Desulforhopalus singaporensis TaxID=91360 RepID=A0A1H0STU1_9BACT|nr:MFS transporter [Desulforhopalus singaporensis]SDP45035.1 drug resistance transporter, EmrB/QacA subfamily [Desulforhopalus singaporensis]
MRETTSQNRSFIIVAALLALFLGALDALIVSAAMPSVVADLGGLSLYSWVYSAYFLARAVSLPVLGKLADRYCARTLFLFSITVFMLASFVAGAAPSMAVLIGARVFQGVGAGGIFSLVYIVLSSVSSGGERGKTLSLASSVWGISSIIGPTLGGFIVTYVSWRWIFFLNVPLGLASLVIIRRCMQPRTGGGKKVHLDIAGITCLSGFILCFLTIFIVGGHNYPWFSSEITGLGAMSLIFAVFFIVAEKRAVDPVLDLGFFARPVFALGNCAVFCASFAIFALFAYVPIFIEGALAKTPMEVGVTMLALSLGWSAGSLLLGRFVDGTGSGHAAVLGGLILAGSTAALLWLTPQTSLTVCFVVFILAGFGMGFVTLSTLLLVQADLSRTNLGVATSFHQFSRTLGGTIGVGICGGVVTTELLQNLQASSTMIPVAIVELLDKSLENLFRQEFRQILDQQSEALIALAVSDAMLPVFRIIVAVSLLCFVCTLLLRSRVPASK